MDIGASFADDFFEKPREKLGQNTDGYEAKLCVPLWFMEDHSCKEPSEQLVALKHQADHLYYQKNYTKASEAYERCLNRVPSSNNTWRREFYENLSRCALQLGNAEKALEWSLKLYEASISQDQKVVSMNLLASVCHNLGKYKEELEALHCCIDAHKSCPEFWLRLGLCYAGLFNIELPGCTLFKSELESDDQEPCCAFRLKSFSSLSKEVSDLNASEPICSDRSAIIPSSSSLAEICSIKDDKSALKCEICTLGVQIVSSCLIHTRMLLDSGGPNVLGVERDKKIKDKIAVCLKHMEVDQSFIDIASTMLGTDFLSGFQENRSTLEKQESVFSKLKVDKNV